jgi:hypothetical protein
MSCARYIIVCEGESEWAYLQRLQSFLEQQQPADGSFEPPLLFIVPERVIVKTGTFGKLKSRYNKMRKENKNTAIKIWADFDLYNRNDKKCADHYAAKTAGIPDFLFSFHNFEDFYALHFDGPELAEWLRFGNNGHFTTPLHSVSYLPEIKKIFPDYGKGSLPANFITWDALKNLKRNRFHQPTSNPSNLQGLGSFADFLITEIERAYPGSLDVAPTIPAQP